MLTDVLCLPELKSLIDSNNFSTVQSLKLEILQSLFTSPPINYIVIILKEVCVFHNITKILL